MSEWSREPTVLWRHNSDRVLLLPQGSDEALLLDGIGAAVWQALGAPTQIHELVDALAKVVATPAERIEADLVAFLEDLRQRGALVASDVG